MFSGIVEETGKILKKIFSNGVLRLRIEANKVFEDLKEGDSIAVNGVCLTVEKIEKNSFYVSLSKNTQKETNLGKINIGEKVNLERAIKVGERIGGHILTGHIDFQTPIYQIERHGNTAILKLKIPKEFEKYVVRRGNIGIDGISLTVSEIKNSIISFNLIPYTIENTNLKEKIPGNCVNVEVDIFAKYIEKIVREK
ncbi:MAG: riboflavin synthase [Candidatus Omnitrophota bacterium]|nr:MAG: riboflavin synthase [Candidatus Omnitrophota bacterium]